MATTGVHAAHAAGGKAASSDAGARPAGAAVAKRLQQELMQLMMGGNKDIAAFPNGDNLFEWTGTLKGSKETAYEGCAFKLKLKFPRTTRSQHQPSHSLRRAGTPTWTKLVTSVWIS